jgi:copper chaperone
MAVERTLRELKGVTLIEVKLESGQVTVNYDENLVQEPQIVEAITEAGYSVQK